MSSRALHAAQIFWPAFIIAGILEILVFAWIDPSTLILAGLPLDEKGVYSLAFFVFWGFVSVAALLSHWLIKAADLSAAWGQAEHSPSRRRPSRRHTRSLA